MTAAESDLWRRWKTRRDRDAFRGLVAAHEAFVHDFARRLCGHDADAEDIAQEAFLELAEAPIERPIEVGLRAFLGRRIVLAAKTLRRAALSRRAKEAQAPLPVERAAVHAETEEALALLDAEEREAVTLRFLHGLSYAEVAEVLDLSDGAARVRVHRALQRLRARLGPRAEGAIAALPLFLPAKTFSHAAAGAAVLGRGALVMAASGNRYLIVALALLLLVGGFIAVRAIPARTTARTVTRATDAPTPNSGDANEDTAARDGATAPTTRAQERAVPQATEGDEGSASPSVTGRLRFTDGAPASGLRLRLEAHLDEVTTDGEGRFRFEGTAPPPLDKLYHVGPDDYILSLATVGGDAKDVIIERGLAFEGSVAIEGTGQPVAGALLELTRPGAAATKTVQAAWGKAKTNAEGRFAFEHVLPATYDLVIMAKGIEPRKTSLEVLEGSLPAQILVRPARPMTVRFLGLADAMVGRQVTLGIWAKGGAPLQLWYWDVELDAALEVHAEAPPPGRYGVRIFGPHSEPTTPVRAKEAEFESVPGEPLLVVLEPAAGRARVEGTVLLPDGRPASDCFVRLDHAQLNTRTDGLGRFAFDEVPSGEQQLTLRFGMTDVPREKLDVPVEGTVRCDVRLTGTGTVIGRFTSSGLALNAGVILRRKSDGKRAGYASFAIGSDGSFRFPYVEPGEYELAAFVMRKGSTRRDVTVAGGTVDLGDFAIDPTPEVPIVATVPAGLKVAANVQVRGKGEGGDVYGWLALGDDGRGFLSGFATGRYRLSFTVPGCAPLEVDAVIEAEPVRPLTFTLLPE